MPFADPEKNRSYQRDYKRLQRAGGCQTPGQTRLPVEFRLKTAADVQALLDEQVAAVRQDGSLGSVERAKEPGVDLERLDSSSPLVEWQTSTPRGTGLNSPVPAKRKSRHEAG